MGLDCVVDSTVLGRPAHKRQRTNGMGSVQGRQATASGDFREGREPAKPQTTDIKKFLLSYSQDSGVAGSSHGQPSPSKLEIYESLRSPVHLLSLLLSRDERFAKSTAIQSSALAQVSASDLITDEVAVMLDQHLVWHKLYFPYIPPLRILRQQVVASNHLDDASTVFLFALLCLIALDVPRSRLATHRHLQPALQSIVFCYGQATLFNVPEHRHSILALELIAEYRPLALVFSQLGAGRSLKGELYSTLAKRVALKLSLNDASSLLRERIRNAGSNDVEQLILDCLQWCSLTMAEIEAERYARGPRHGERDPHTSMQSSLEILRAFIGSGQMPAKTLFLFHRLASFTSELQAVHDITKGWSNLEILVDVMNRHEMSSKQEKEQFSIALQQLNEGRGQAEEAFPLLQLFDVELHIRHTNVVGLALFCAVMSGAHPGAIQDLNPEEVLQLGDHIIDNLKAHSADDPSRSSTRVFLERYGNSRLDELQRILTNFINLSDNVSLHGVRFTGLMRHTSSEILFTCKDIVENNAARLKGWGGLHDGIDMQLILFLECARRLEAMTQDENTEQAIAKGNLLAASANLIRNLHQIMLGWKRTVAEKERQTITSSMLSGGGSGSSNITPAPFIDTNDWLSDDFFADWNNWPQMDICDFSQWLVDDLS